MRCPTDCTKCLKHRSLGVTCVASFLVAFISAHHVKAQSIDKAYRTELSRLTAERKSLRQALALAENRNKKARVALIEELESLAGKLTVLRANNTQNEIQLPRAEQMRSMQEQERAVTQRKEQIKSWLHLQNVNSSSLPTPQDTSKSDEQAPLDLMITTALHHVAKSGKLRVQPEQTYFGRGGVVTTGSVVHIAQVGAATSDGLEPLVLGPDGSLRVTQSVAKPVSHGDSRSVGVVLFDPAEITSLAPPQTGLRGWIERGGIIMWAIAALAMLAIMLSIERIAALTSYYLRVRAAEREGPQTPVDADKTPMYPIGLVQNGTKNPDALEHAAAEAILEIKPVMRRGVSLLSVVASVAPLLGLLGTVTGMIGTFAVITEHGTGDPRLLSGGISEALLTTQFGLMVAIPALLLQTTFYRTGDAILRRVEKFALVVLQSRNVGANDDLLPLQSAQRHAG